MRFAEVLAENGAAVALVARRADRLAAVKARIEAAGGRAVAIEADVLDRNAMARAFDEAEKAFGTVTILVNNAGVAHSDARGRTDRGGMAPRASAPISMRCSSGRRRPRAACWPPKKTGAIVNIASVLGLAVSKGTVAYAVAKAGVIQLTKTLGLELAFKGIRVNAIAPGWIVTDINRDFLLSEHGAAIKREIPVGRFGEERDLDGALCCWPRTPAVSSPAPPSWSTAANWWDRGELLSAGDR